MYPCRDEWQVVDFDQRAQLASAVRHMDAADLFETIITRYDEINFKPLVFSCTVDTVDLAQTIYGADAYHLGVTFDEARAACSEYGMSMQPDW